MLKKILLSFLLASFANFLNAQDIPTVDDVNKNGRWDKKESFKDENLNGLYDSGSSLKSYFVLLGETDFLKWTLNSLLVSFVVTLTGVALASTSAFALSRFEFKGRQFGMIALLTTQMFPATMLLLPFFICLEIELHTIS